MGSKFTFGEMQGVVSAARGRLNEIIDRGTEICSGYGPHVEQVLAYHESIKEEAAELTKRISHYEPLIAKAIEEDMSEDCSA